MKKKSDKSEAEGITPTFFGATNLIRLVFALKFVLPEIVLFEEWESSKSVELREEF